MHRTPNRVGVRAVTAIATMALAAGTIAACSSSEAPVDSNSTEDRDLTIAIGGAPPSFDPTQADLGESQYIWGSIYDTLLIQDEQAVVQPNAAESWSYSDDALTLTLTLRDDLTFSTGDAVTAEAVKATLERDISTPGYRQADAARIESVETPDDTTVIINLTEPDPTLLINLSQGLGIIADPATIEDEGSALDPIGSGPYTLDKDASVNGSSYVLNRRDDYWNVDAYPFSQVTVRVIEDRQALYNALQAGELDAGGVQGDQVEPIQAAGFNTKQIDAAAVATFAILDRDGTLVPALGDVRVRQAINMAFDRDTYLSALGLGVGKTTVQLFNPVQGAYDASLEDYYEYDPDGARDLLEEAGYPNGFELTVPSTYFSTRFEAAVTQSLGDIGITLNWQPVPPQDIASSISSQQYAAAWFYDGLAAPAREYANNFAVDGFLNPFHFEDPELTALSEQVAVTTDLDAANEIYQQINAFIVENALTAPVMYSGATWATKDGVVYLPEGSVPPRVRNFGVE